MSIQQKTNPQGSQQQSSGGSSTGYNYGYYPASYSYGDKADLLDKIKPEQIVHVFMHQLMGERFKDNQWVMDKDLEPRSLSKIGAWDISNLMLSASSQNVSLGNLNDDEIRARALEIAKTAIFMCMRNYRVYHIRGRDHIRFIYQIVFGNTLITLKQSQNEGIRSLLKGTTSEVRTVSENQNGGGFLSRLFNRGGRR